MKRSGPRCVAEIVSSSSEYFPHDVSAHVRPHYAVPGMVGGTLLPVVWYDSLHVSVSAAPVSNSSLDVGASGRTDAPSANRPPLKQVWGHEACTPVTFVFYRQTSARTGMRSPGR